MLPTRIKKPASPPLRRAVITVEFAIVCPILFMFILASIEFSRANMIRNSVQNAAYQGARCGILPGATKSECVAAVQSQLDIIGISAATVTVTPANLDNAEEVSVSISVNMNGTNGYVVPNFFLSKTISSSITLTRE